MEKILVPLDGSSLANSVLPHVGALTRATGAQVTLLRVLENPYENSLDVDPVDWHLRKNEAQAALEEVGSYLKIFHVDADMVLLEGPAAARIIEYAQHHDFDLIVLSSHGQHGLSGWNLSSVAQKIIHRSRKSTLLVRAYRENPLHIWWNEVERTGADAGPDEETEENLAVTEPPQKLYQRILVPLDGSQRAEHVLSTATSLARSQEAELLLAHVVEPPEMIQRMPLADEDKQLIERVVERNKFQIHKYFEQLQNRLSPVPKTQMLVDSDTSSALHKLVQDQDVDLVIVSAHGYSGRAQQPYGDVASSLLYYGNSAILMLQDLPAHEIEQTEAERAFLSTQKHEENRIDAHGDYRIDTYDYAAN